MRCILDSLEVHTLSTSSDVSRRVFTLFCFCEPCSLSVVDLSLNNNMGDDSEVTSSSAASGGQHGHSQIIIADVIVNQSHNSDDIGSGGGDVDLDLWDLDLNVNSVYGDGVPVHGQVSNGHNNHSVPPAKRTHMRNNSLAISSFSDSSSGISHFLPNIEHFILYLDKLHRFHIFVFLPIC